MLRDFVGGEWEAGAKGVDPAGTFFIFTSKPVQAQWRKKRPKKSYRNRLYALCKRWSGTISFFPFLPVDRSMLPMGAICTWYLHSPLFGAVPLGLSEILFAQ